MRADGLDRLLADPKVLARREGAKRRAALAFDLAPKERREARALRDLGALGVALAEDVRVVGALRERERRRAAELGEAPRQPGLRLRRRREVRERLERRRGPPRRLGRERAEKRVEHMKRRTGERRDRDRVPIRRQRADRVRDRDLPRIAEPGERPSGLGALPGRKALRVRHHATELCRGLCANSGRSFAVRPARLDREDARVARAAERGPRGVDHAMTERFTGVRPREGIERDVAVRIVRPRRDLEQRRHRFGAELLLSLREVAEAEERGLRPRAVHLEERDQRLLGERPSAPPGGARDRDVGIDLRDAT